MSSVLAALADDAAGDSEGVVTVQSARVKLEVVLNVCSTHAESKVVRYGPGTRLGGCC